VCWCTGVLCVNLLISWWLFRHVDVWCVMMYWWHVIVLIVLMCWCIDWYVDLSMRKCVDVLMTLCRCVAVLMCWRCVDDVLTMCWCGVLVYRWVSWYCWGCVDMLMCWWYCAGIVLMCWCVVGSFFSGRIVEFPLQNVFFLSTPYFRKV
jgi:hypothetical protein